MKKIKYGIIGFGEIAETRIAKEGFGLDTSRFSGNPYASLVTVYNRNPAKRAAVEQLGLIWKNNFSDFINDPSIDAVVVSTNNKTHVEFAHRAFEAGKHVFLEKPAGTNLEEVVKLVEEARLRGLSLGINHMMTKNCFNILARDMIRNGFIGDWRNLALHMEYPSGFSDSEIRSWRCADPEELGGPIGDVGSHCLYMAEFLTGEIIQSLQCVYLPKHMPIAVEDGAIIRFTTESGRSGTVHVAFDEYRGPENTLFRSHGYTVWGTRGALYGNATLFQLSGYKDEPARVELISQVDGVEQHHVPEHINNIYMEQISEHARSIAEKKPQDGREALHNMEMIVASHRSAREGGTLQKISSFTD